jgi:hypothetical protein
VPVGTTVAFTLTRPAAVRLHFTRTITGRKVGKRCQAAHKTSIRSARCTRGVAVGALTLSGHTGSNRLRFDGRLAGHTLPPGAYTVTILATAGGETATARPLPFKIVSR